jgi:hypothetical protein
MSTDGAARRTALDDVDAAFAEVAERRAAAAAHDRAWKSLWLAHHWPHRYERCTIVRGRHVCRRCLWFYSVSLLTLAAAALDLSPWPTTWDVALVWVLSIPATVEFLGGELGWWSYDARRQIVVTSVLGLAVGRGFHAELTNPGSWTFWGPVLVFGTLWFVVAAGAWWIKRGQYRED